MFLENLKKMTEKSVKFDYKSSKVWLASMNAFLGSFILSYNIGVFTSCQPSVASDLHWGKNSKLLIALTSSLLPLGALFGALLSGVCSKFKGHRFNLMFADLIAIFAGGLTVIPTTLTFAFGRFISGISIGMFSVLCPLYVNEIAPPVISGRLGSLIQPFCCSGLITAYALALLLPTGDYGNDKRNQLWMMMFALQGVVAFVQFLGFLVVFVHETPQWHINKSNPNKALKSLQFLYTEESAQTILKSLQDTSSSKSTAPEFSYIQLLKCSKGVRKSMRLGLMLSLVQQFSGINAILTYATSLFGEFGSGVFISRVLTLANGFVNFSATFCLMKFIDGLGRKWTLVGGTMTMGVCLVLLSLFSALNVFYLLVFLVIQVYVLCYGLSIGPICWIYSGEILTSRGLSICSAVNWFSAFIVILFFPFMVTALGLSITFGIFSIVNILGAIYFAVDMIETKGMRKCDIQSLFLVDLKELEKY